MGLFKKKIDSKTQEFLKKTELAELTVRSTIALIAAPSTLYGGFPEGIGSLVLNTDGSGFLWKMIDMQGIPIGDEIAFDSLQGWGSLAKNPKFGFVLKSFSEYDGILNQRPTEEIYFDVSPWTFAITNDPEKNGDISLVSEWITKHYPNLKFDS